MKRKRKISVIIVIGILVSTIVMAILNIFVFKNSNFWEMSVSQVLTLLVAITITFWAAQRKTDERKIKEQIERIVEKIQREVSSPEFVTFNLTNDPIDVQKKISITTRKIKNCINVLREYEKVIKISEEIRYIEDQVKSYHDFVSVKVGDLDYLSKSETHLRMYAENINSKCDYLILLLYTKL